MTPRLPGKFKAGGRKGALSREFLSFLAFLFFVFLAVFLGKRFRLDDSLIRQQLSAAPLLLGAAAFVFLYICITFFLWFSKDVLRLAAALVFGPAVSTLLVWLGEMGNCWVLFYFSRKMGRGFILRRLPAKPLGMYERLGVTGFGWLLLLRSTPVFPFRFLDINAGLSALPFVKYFASAAIGSPLRIFWMQFVLAGVGKAAFNPKALSEYIGIHPGFILFSLLYFAFMVAAFLVIRKREKKWRLR